MDDILEQIDFARNAITKSTSKTITIRVIVSLGKHKKQEKVALDIKEIEFDDKSATIYLIV